MSLDDPVVTLLLSAFISWVTAALLAGVGQSVFARLSQDESRFAGAMFGYGWYGLSSSAVVKGLSQLTGALGIDSLAWHVALQTTWYVLIAVSLWAVCTYLLYLFTGERTFTIPLAVFYGSALVGILLLVSGARPHTVSIEHWQVELVYANAGFAGAAPRLVALVMLIPLVGGALGYLALLNVVTARTPRFRIITVSATLALWFGISGLAHALDLHQTDAWAFTKLVLALGAATLLVVAYRPPAWLQRKLRLEPETPESATPQHHGS